MAFQNGDLIVVNRNGIDYKALIDDLIAGDAGDGAINIEGGDGISATGSNATANQSTATTRTLTVKTGSGIIIDANGNVIIDPNFNLDGNITDPGDGAIAFNAGAGLAESGTNATANQTGDTAKTFSVKTSDGIIIDGSGNIIIDPNFNLDGSITPPGDGAINVDAGLGLEATGANATANQTAPTTRTLSAKTADGITIDGSGNIIIDPSFNLDGNITPPGDGKITLNSYDGSKVGEFTVNQSGPTTITLPEIVVPESLHPKGFIDVSQPAPADPEHGDIYIQHRNDLADVVAVASFTGIAGRTITDGQFVMFGVDDLWHAGGDAAPTEHQADWAQTDANAIDYIKNKPDLQAEVDKFAGDGAINVNAGPGIEAAGSNATANQKTGTTRTLSVKTGDGITIDANGNVIIDPSFNLDGNITAPNNGVLTVKDHTGTTVGTFSANQAGNTEVTLPVPSTVNDAPNDGEAYVRLSEDWEKLEHTPDTFSDVKGIMLTQVDNSNVNTSQIYITSNKVYVHSSYEDNQVFDIANYGYITFNDCRMQIAKKEIDADSLVLSHYGFCGGASNIPDPGTKVNVFNDSTPTPQPGPTVYRSFPEAPSTGSQYVRQDGDWVEIEIDPDAAFPEAPDSDYIYARDGRNKVWEKALPYDLSKLPVL